MRLRLLLLALLIGAGLLAPVQAALAKNTYKYQKFKKYKGRKARKIKVTKPAKRRVAHPQIRRHA